MKLLFITPLIPFPLSEGGKISQFAMLDYLRKHHTITLVVVAYTLVDLDYIEALKNLLPEVKIENINLIAPTIEIPFIKRNIRNLRYRLSSFMSSPDRQKLRENGIYYSDYDNVALVNIPHIKDKKLITGLQHIIAKDTYDIVQIDMIDFVDIVQLIDSSAKKVFVHHELRFGRLDSTISSSKRNAYQQYVFKFVKNAELSYMRKYDAIFVFSEEDKIKIEEDHDLQNKVYVSPFSVLDQYFAPVTKQDAVIHKLVFIGGEGHHPNLEAVQWFISEIQPLISHQNNIKLHVIGSWEQATIEQIDENKIVCFAGFVDDLISYCKSSIMIVPIQTGSGIRTKILYAMAQGLPIISTSIGCEGINVQHNESILMADTPYDFAAAINKLVNDLELRQKLAVEAQKIATDVYSQKSAGALRNKLLEALVS